MTPKVPHLLPLSDFFVSSCFKLILGSSVCTDLLNQPGDFSSCFWRHLSISTSFWSFSTISFIFIIWSTIFSFSITTRSTSSAFAFFNSSFSSCNERMESLSPIYCFSAKLDTDCASVSSAVKCDIVFSARSFSSFRLDMVASWAVFVSFKLEISLAVFNAASVVSTSARSFSLSCSCSFSIFSRCRTSFLFGPFPPASSLIFSISVF
mmetsp:Transcript_9539/g.20195  ORF Transcript_9539/g.20195 Transcript_9539/m.20195 type:complete len:208 (-) Transcript_9539:231-854(-)